MSVLLQRSIAHARNCADCCLRSVFWFSVCCKLSGLPETLHQIPVADLQNSRSDLLLLYSCACMQQEDVCKLVLTVSSAAVWGGRGPTECLSLQVFILPTIRINNGQYRGKLAYAEVLQAICAGFSYGAEPSVCMQEDTCREGSQPDTDCKSRYPPITNLVCRLSAL